MEFRIADSNDVDRLAELRWTHKNEDEPLDDGAPYDINDRDEYVSKCSKFLKQALNEEISCWVAVDDGLVIAHIYVVKIRKIPKPGKMNGILGYMTAVYTAPEYRNRGVGSALMDKVKAWCLEEGIESLVVWPSKPSVPFYERAGFNKDTDVLELEL